MFTDFFCRPKGRKPPKFLYNPAFEGDIERVVLMLGKLDNFHIRESVIRKARSHTP